MFFFNVLTVDFNASKLLSPQLIYSHLVFTKLPFTDILAKTPLNI
jgi:hypothetical protein